VLLETDDGVGAGFRVQCLGFKLYLWTDDGRGRGRGSAKRKWREKARRRGWWAGRNSEMYCV
jgi:hypothetical protein